MDAGDTVSDGVVAPPGLHRNAGLLTLVLAVNTAESPAQIVVEFTLTLGSGLTVTVPVPVPAHPVVPSVTITV